jgi:DNA-directed RNA polymerase subunit RPC12/RpoP
MKMIAARCPSCSGDLQVATGQQLTACTYCGSMVFVQWDDASQPHLTKIESDLARIERMVTVNAAHTRLEYIDDDIDQARQSVEARTWETVTALNAQATLRQQSQMAIRNRQIYALGAAALGLFLVLFTVFNLDWSGSCVTLLLAVAMTGAVWYHGSEWKKLVEQTPGQMQAARERVQQASASLLEAQAQLEQLESEKDVCERHVRDYRHTGGARD